jgi:KipI family sensor histidine kinase inhibitor
MSNTVIFVYGTLKQGEAQELGAFKPTPRFLGEGWMQGRLYNLGHCPGMVLDSAGSPVWGEVYEIDSDLFEELDRWEAECGEFVLTEGTAWVADRPVNVKVYVVGAEQPLPDMPVKSGRWSTRTNAAGGEERRHVIPVCFGGVFGPDLEKVGELSGLLPEALIALLTSQRYEVTGESARPAFRHLKGVPEAVRSVRRSVPRAGVAAGTLGILDGHCGLYPVTGPASWSLIGRTPLVPGRQVLELLPGDTVEFRRISVEEYEQKLCVGEVAQVEACYGR